MQLLDDGDVQLLSCNEQSEVAATQRGGNCRLKKGLTENALDEGDWLDWPLTGAMSALSARRNGKRRDR
jgi:hypothetical protein